MTLWILFRFFDLPCGSLMRYCKLDEEEDTEEKTPDIHEWTEADKGDSREPIEPERKRMSGF